MPQVTSSFKLRVITLNKLLPLTLQSEEEEEYCHFCLQATSAFYLTGFTFIGNNAVMLVTMAAMCGQTNALNKNFFFVPQRIPVPSFLSPTLMSKDEQLSAALTSNGTPPSSLRPLLCTLVTL